MRKLMVLIISGIAGFSNAHAKEAPANLEHPGEVALLEEETGYIYRTFPAQLRMYVYDKDKPGKLGCLEGCINAWPPVWAPNDAQPKGDWSLIDRVERGRKQWVYKGRPAYTRFHDSAAEATGVGLDKGAWHFLEP